MDSSKNKESFGSDKSGILHDNTVIKAVIIDDQEISRIHLFSLLKEHCPRIEVAGMADTVDSAVKVIQSQFPQLVFLDVELIKGNGFEILDRVSDKNFEVIITSGYEKYALQAIKHEVVDFLQKPVDGQDLIVAVNKWEKRLMLNVTVNNHSDLFQEEKISLNTTKGTELIPVNQIVRCESDHYYSYVFIHGRKKLLVTKTLKELEKSLEMYDFFRVHQSHLVNLKYLKTFLKAESSILLIGGEKIPVSRRKKEFLKQKLG